MIYKEEKRDLFTVDNSYFLAHCISADFALGAGIAKEIDKRFDVREKLFWSFKNYRLDYHAWYVGKDALCKEDGDALWCCKQTGRVLNLITKERYWHKPTYDSLRRALEHLKDYMHEIYEPNAKIAMPKIGCGLDKLQWDKVSEIIKDVFKDTDFEILVCYQ